MEVPISWIIAIILIIILFLQLFNFISLTGLYHNIWVKRYDNLIFAETDKIQKWMDKRAKHIKDVPKIEVIEVVVPETKPEKTPEKSLDVAEVIELVKAHDKQVKALIAKIKTK